LEERGESAQRKIVLVPESAHGTNPATAAQLGFEVRSAPAGSDGNVHLAAVRELLGPDVAAIMLTNPNTCGLFEPEAIGVAEATHQAGAYFYCDGANFNAIMGKARPGDLGVDAMHINLHKTFSTPHGGGGPGSGPVVFSDRLARFAPVPYTLLDQNGLRLVEQADESSAFGRITAFHGQMGMFVRALAFMLSHGGDGLRRAAEDAVLNANYLRVCLKDLLSAPFGDRPCMHEVLFDDRWLAGTGVTTLDFAKSMIDEGYHPMTMYFPLVAHGAMLIEPTESESRASLDLFVMTLRELAMRALRGEAERFVRAPQFAPRKRLDETQAARQPVLKWTKPAPVQAEAAE
jgi:glycine dehydrogenase subunit 2